MSQPKANCPNCGAEITFRYSGAVQTTCEYCKSILVRHDLDLQKVGVVSDLPPDISPLQIGSEGVFDGRAFQAVGRIIYSYDLGSWNEWHLGFSDGSSGWLSDAQAEYFVSFLKQPGFLIPSPSSLRPFQKFSSNGVDLFVTTITTAHYKGVEGELPFEYWDKKACQFADLRSYDGRFATFDYSEEPPLYFEGRSVSFDELKLKNLKEFEGWPA